jgi:4-alpha-glucanotransferase
MCTLEKRAGGILLHISSLPSKYGVGDFGPVAYKFADYLKQAGQRYWQVLPLNQVDPKGGYCPYDCSSAFAGNILFISPELLVEQDLLTKKHIRDKPSFPKAEVNFRKAASYKAKLLDIAYERFKNTAAREGYEKFCSDNSGWLEDYALFAAIAKRFNYRQWYTWPNELRDRKNNALKSVKTKLEDSVNKEKFQQYLFFRQWLSLKKYCRKLGIRIIGDVPIYVSRDGADTWTHPEIFKLTKSKKPRFIAGVPPDLFSRTGQLWGNTVYDWKALKRTGYRWWMQRIDHNLTLFDIVRLDHFRGFISYWQVPAGSKTAKRGRWIQGPKEDFFNKLFGRFPVSRFIAEDLGYITADVRDIIEKYQLTSTKVLMFGFDGNTAENPHCPVNYVRNSVVYTGTHDNNTIKGWFRNEAGPLQKKRLFYFTGGKAPLSRVHWAVIRLASSSVSNTVIIPMQDVLGLGEKARMNKPATVRNNWKWRLKPKDLNASTSGKLARLTKIYGRI